MPTLTALHWRLQQLEAQDRSARVPVTVIALDHSGMEVARTNWFVDRACTARFPARFTLDLGERTAHRPP